MKDLSMKKPHAILYLTLTLLAKPNFFVDIYISSDILFVPMT